MSQQLSQSTNVTILGASFVRGVGGRVVDDSIESNLYDSILTAAAIIQSDSLAGARSVNMFIIDKPTTYEYIDNATNRTLASSIIIANIRRNTSASTPINILLYFRVLDEWKPNVTDVDYYCSFYDINRSQWNESGCTKPWYSVQFNRYECTCSHLSTFALLWSPTRPSCDNATHQIWINGTCISKLDAQVFYPLFSSFPFVLSSI